MKYVTIPAQWLQELIALCGPEDHELRERVMKTAATAPADALATATGLPAQAPMQCVECNSCGSAFVVDSYLAGYTDGKGHCLNCPGVDHAAPQAQKGQP